MTKESKQRLAGAGAVLYLLVIAAAYLWDPRRGGGGVLVTTGTGLLVGATVFFIQRVLFLRRGRIADGEVVGLVALSPGNPCLAPVFRFTDDTATERTVTSRAAASPPSYQVGDRVPVLFLPDRPEQAEIRSFGALWGGGLIMACLGATLLVVGVLFLLNVLHPPPVWGR